MIWLDYLRTALWMVKAKPVRAALSVTGIFVGVLALAVILCVSEGVKRTLAESFSTRGATIFFVYPGFDQATRSVGRVTPDDLIRLREIPGIVSVLPRRTLDWTARSESGSSALRVTGVDADFFQVYRIRFLRGRPFTKAETERRSPVCVLTQEKAVELFPYADPVGASLTLNGVSFQVIGVVEWEFGAGVRTNLFDTTAFVSMAWVEGDAPAASFFSVTEVRAAADLPPREVQRRITAVLTRGESSREKLFMLRSLDEMGEKMREMQDRILRGLLAIAAISLLVGAIGIANIMITSVTERTREVGVRKAVGAGRIDILLQFLVESAVLTGLGGACAVSLAAFSTLVVPALLGVQWPLAVPWIQLGFCLAGSLAVGVIAGLYPANQAARLSPAEALRYE